MKNLKSFQNYRINEELFGMKSSEREYWSKPYAGKDVIKQIWQKLCEYESNKDNLPGGGETYQENKSKVDKMINFIKETIVSYFESYYNNKMTSSQSSALKKVLQTLNQGRTFNIYIELDGRRTTIYDNYTEGMCEETVTVLQSIKSKLDKIVGK